MHQIAVYAGVLSVGFAMGLMVNSGGSEQLASTNSGMDSAEWAELRAEIATIRNHQLENSQVNLSDGSSISLSQIQDALTMVLQKQNINEMVKNSMKAGLDELEQNMRLDMQNAQSLAYEEPSAEEMIQKTIIPKQPSADQEASYQALQTMLENNNIKKNFDMDFIVGTKEYSELHPIQKQNLTSEIYKKIGMGELVIKEGHSH